MPRSYYCSDHGDYTGSNCPRCQADENSQNIVDSISELVQSGNDNTGEIRQALEDSAYRYNNPGDYDCPECGLRALKRYGRKCPKCRSEITSEYWTRVEEEEKIIAERKEAQKIIAQKLAKAREEEKLDEAAGNAMGFVLIILVICIIVGISKFITNTKGGDPKTTAIAASKETIAASISSATTAAPFKKFINSNIRDYILPSRTSYPPEEIIDQYICPGEGCRYSKKWVVINAVDVYEKPPNKLGTPVSLLIKKTTLMVGTSVKAETGHVLAAHSEGRVTSQTHFQYGDDSKKPWLMSGQIIPIYTYLGEGGVRAWIDGKYFIIYGLDYSQLGQSEWWIQIWLPDNTIGWIKSDAFYTY